MGMVFLAISRTGPDPVRHDVYELAAVHRMDHGGTLQERAYHWAMRPARLAVADPEELMRTRYFERSAMWLHDSPAVSLDPTLGASKLTTFAAIAHTLARMLLGSQLATFGLDREGEFVAEMLRTLGEPAGWVGHLDLSSAAAGTVTGYSQGWAARGRHDQAAPAPGAVDLTAALLPLDPFHLARAIGLQPADDVASALQRAYLARDMWTKIMAPVALGEPEPAAGAHAAEKPAEAPAPAIAAAPTGEHRVPSSVPSFTDDDPELDRVIASLGRPEAD
jgi:hypothetical protein